jgi:hypothetical protein
MPPLKRGYDYDYVYFSVDIFLRFPDWVFFGGVALLCCWSAIWNMFEIFCVRPRLFFSFGRTVDHPIRM